ncbi:MAG: replicative DNA helicase [Leptospiraceae bacterium]|nr:replicative DNA helicase [Leptospiraceae bacterium]
MSFSSTLFENETEKAFLAFILFKGGTDGSELGVDTEDFYNELHRKIFESIKELIDNRVTIDPLSVINQLKEKARIQNEERDSLYIFQLFKDTIAIHPLSYYSRRIKKLSDRRKYYKILQESLQELGTDLEENESLFTKIESELSKISRETQSRGLRLIKEDMNELIEYVKVMRETKGMNAGLRTHITELDEVTTGLKSGELFVLAARPGHGKTTFALNLAANVALKEKKVVAIFSLEMSRMELLIKIICSEARLNSTLLKTGSFQASDFQQIIKSITSVTNTQIYIDDYGALTIWELKSRIRQLLTITPVSLIVVDYLQLLSDPSNRDMGRQQEVASISRNLKQIAKEANCPVIAISQMSRAVESRGKDQRPQLSDLRESGAIEQDADIVAFIYREDKVKSPDELPPEKKNKAEIIIAKNRSGAVKSFELMFTPEYSKFDNL